ncbi:cleft lip and palate transmembrane protein 1 [Platysternon megacephalum]|uniref:Cleft lip and palate transmembrane protein 1 n=1 Tax=Platysternon megacephalum TaxID=55544 RepID=A0A4D9DW70_9SAUR|nr:cleft lip and palate transmembrane protein 1 [Platysternon megacephalum]
MVARNKHVAKLWDESWAQPEVPRRAWKMMEKLRTPPPPCSPLPPPSPPASHPPPPSPPAPKGSPPPPAPAPLPPDVPVISLGHSKRPPPPDVPTTELTALHPIPSLVQLSALPPAPPPAPMPLAGLQSPLLPPQYHPHPFLNRSVLGALGLGGLVVFWRVRSLRADKTPPPYRGPGGVTPPPQHPSLWLLSCPHPLSQTQCWGGYGTDLGVCDTPPPPHGCNVPWWGCQGGAD